MRITPSPPHTVSSPNVAKARPQVEPDAMLKPTETLELSQDVTGMEASPQYSLSLSEKLNVGLMTMSGFVPVGSILMAPALGAVAALHCAAPDESALKNLGRLAGGFLVGLGLSAASTFFPPLGILTAAFTGLAAGKITHSASAQQASEQRAADSHAAKLVEESPLLESVRSTDGWATFTTTGGKNFSGGKYHISTPDGDLNGSLRVGETGPILRRLVADPLYPGVWDTYSYAQALQPDGSSKIQVDADGMVFRGSLGPDGKPTEPGKLTLGATKLTQSTEFKTAPEGGVIVGEKWYKGFSVYPDPPSA